MAVIDDDRCSSLVLEIRRLPCSIACLTRRSPETIAYEQFVPKPPARIIARSQSHTKQKEGSRPDQPSRPPAEQAPSALGWRQRSGGDTQTLSDLALEAGSSGGRGAKLSPALSTPLVQVTLLPQFAARDSPSPSYCTYTRNKHIFTPRFATCSC